jgi:4-alpha-glucanotransferase
MRATIHFSGEQIVVSFESEYAFVKWLGYLKDHGLASVKLAESDRSVIIFRDQVTYIASSSAELTLP